MTHPDTTVIYYTSNREKPEFEQRIIRSMRHASRSLPIISVSQKPIDLGENICVGDVGQSSRNIFRQMEVGAKAAKTRYVCPAESDTIYPKEYFSFVPPRDDVFYIASPLYVCFHQRGYKRYFAPKPRGSESAMVCNRELLLARLKAMLSNGPEWSRTDEDRLWLIYRQRCEFFQLDTPVVTFKTDKNLHRKTPHDVETKLLELPGYGSVKNLIQRYSR